MVTSSEPPSSTCPPALDEPETWERLIESVGPAALLLVIEGRMGTRLLARHRPEDVLQEVLLEAWRSRASLRWQGLAAFRNWLLTIADHRTADLAKREGAEKRGGRTRELRFSELGSSHSPGLSDSDMPLRTTTPGRMAAAREQAEAMRAALEALPERLREVVRLRLFEQHSSSETAQRLGLGLSAVKHRFLAGARLYKARLLLVLASCTSRPSNS